LSETHTVEPFGLVHGVEAALALASGVAQPLTANGTAFTFARLMNEGGRIVPAATLPEALLRPPPRWAGLSLAEPVIMGIVNVTPDSFSDGGDRLDATQAVGAGLGLAKAGAAIIDVGGESTRPGADPTPPDQEQARILPVIRDLARAGLIVSVDTRNASTMAAALDAGAAIINDVSALSHDPEAAALVARRGCPVVLMHMRGQPKTMQAHATYHDIALEVLKELTDRLNVAEEAGIARERIALDPGIGFAKRARHSGELLGRLPLLLTLGCPLLVGLSRKSLIGALGQTERPKDRIPGSLAGALFALSRGASILRVHDVAETTQAVRVWRAMVGNFEPTGSQR
jgi:dihydropteroate synthase